MLQLLALSALSAQGTPCDVELQVVLLEDSQHSPEAFREELEAELGRRVVLNGAGRCSRVSIVVDVGVVTIGVAVLKSAAQKRLLPRTNATQVVRESVLLAAGLLRTQLEDHLRDLPDATSEPEVSPPAPAKVESPKVNDSPSWWLGGSGVLGITGMGIVSAGLDLHSQRQFGPLSVGVAASSTLGLEHRSIRVQLLPEVGVYGGPSTRLRFGLFLGLGLLLVHEPSSLSGEAPQLFAAFRPRGVIGVALTPQLHLQLTVGMTMAADQYPVRLIFLCSSFGVTYGF